MDTLIIGMGESPSLARMLSRSLPGELLSIPIIASSLTPEERNEDMYSSILPLILRNYDTYRLDDIPLARGEFYRAFKGKSKMFKKNKRKSKKKH